MRILRTLFLTACLGLIVSRGGSMSWAEMTAVGGASPSAPADASQNRDAVVTQTARDGGTILVLGPAIPVAQQVIRGLLDELSGRYTIMTRVISVQTQVAELAQVLDSTKPRVLVLLNNPTVRLYRLYQAMHPQGTCFPPAVILMTAFLEQVAVGLQNVTGISYDVPATTALVNLRSLLERPMHRIGVLHRRGFESYVARHVRLATAEGFTIVSRTLDEGNQQDAVKRGLRRLLDYDHIDALWVLDDSALLSPLLVARAWLPVLRHGHVPVLVGVPSLVSPKLSFGTFAVFPDHRALGAQAADLIDELAEKHWQVGEHRTLLPIAVEKVLNLGLARTVGRLREDRVGEVDRIVGDGRQENR